MDLVSIVYIIEQIFIVFALDKFMKVFFEKRKTPLHAYVLTYLSFLFITVLVFFVLDIPLINLLCNIAAVFLITLNYESSLRRKISAVCFIYAFMFVTDILVASLSGYLFRSIMDEGKYDAELGYITIGLLLYLEAIVAQNFKNIRKANPVSLIFWGSSFAIPISSIFIAVVVLSSENISQAVLISSIVMIFLINVLTFYLHDSLSVAYIDKLNAKLYEQEKDYYYNQCGLMRESMEELRAFKHDIKNHLSILSNYIKKNQRDDAGEYLSGLIGNIAAVANYSDTGNIAFDSIINYKLRKAKEYNVELQTEITIPLDLKIDVADVVTIIGNLLDNAMEAVIKAEERKICLNIVYKKGRILIFSENTYNGTVKCENGEILSAKTGSGHGYGIKNIRRVLEKYNGCIDIAYTDSTFSTDILMYVQSEQ